MHPTIDFKKSYQEAFEGLNEYQRIAVETINGPVLVVAGPGTGKTQILAARIGRILEVTDTKPHNILCLTFTEAGAVNMRQRLSRIIGPPAYQVGIHTFHSFCNEVIQENLDYFGKLQLDPISELENAELFKALIDAFDKENPLKRPTGDVYFEMNRLQKHFGVMKKEDWAPDFILKKIDEYLADLPNREDYIYKVNKKPGTLGGYAKGDLKQSKVDEETARMTLLRAATEQFPIYQRMMNEQNRYTFDDMILWVLNAFKKDENLLAGYRERYQYFLVDEYQDTNGSQNELIQLLLGDDEQPDVFVVGDDDQSIFRFQGANMGNILDFAYKHKQALKTVVLTENYRSTQTVLDVSRQVIEHNKERLTNQLTLNKVLQAANPALQQLSTAPKIVEYPNPHHETAGVGQSISQLIEQGVPANEIAVIYSKHKHAEGLVAYFKSKKIGINLKKKTDLQTTAFAQNLLNILRYLNMELHTPYSGEELLFQLMHYDFFDIAPQKAAQLAAEVSYHNMTRDRRSDKPDQIPTSIRQRIAQYAIPKAPGLFDLPTEEGLIRLSYLVEEWLKDAASKSLQELFDSVVMKGGILKYIMNSSERHWNMEVLACLFDFMKEETHKRPSMGLSDFVDALDLMKKEDISLRLTKTLYAENGVNLMTAHGSKGLEFKHVFIICCMKKEWEKSKSGDRGSYKYPDTLTEKDPDADNLEESRRLFYVAMTRAKQSLTVSYPESDKAEKILERSQFIGEMIAAGTEVEQRTMDPELMFEFMLTQFNEEDKPTVELFDPAYIRNRLEGYELSVTHLNNYLKCPLEFYFQNLVRVPRCISPSLTFGSAVHHALENVYKEMKATGEFPDTTFLIDKFHWYMRRHRESFSKEAFKARSEYGEGILSAYYSKYVKEWPKRSEIEQRIKGVNVDQALIQGQLDKVEFNGLQVNVVDYKTGKHAYAKKKLQPPSEKEPLGGDYWRQAVFYRILIDNDRTRDWEVVSTEFDFVEPTDKDYADYKKEKVIITPDDVAFVKMQITETYTKIMNLEFEQGCGKSDCDWCRFVRNNYKQANLLPAEQDD